VAKWLNVYVLTISSPPGTLGGDSAKFVGVALGRAALERRYGVDRNRSLLVKPYEPPPRRYYPPSIPVEWRQATLEDKLLVVSHGSRDTCGGLSPQVLAETIAHTGLRQVGLISLKGCLLGTGQFVYELKSHLMGRGIVFGWIKAYRGRAVASGVSAAEERVVHYDVYEPDGDHENRHPLAKQAKCLVVRGSAPGHELWSHSARYYVPHLNQIPGVDEFLAHAEALGRPRSQVTAELTLFLEEYGEEAFRLALSRAVEAGMPMPSAVSYYLLTRQSRNQKV
jgi:hypothetical protein